MGDGVLGAQLDGLKGADRNTHSAQRRLEAARRPLAARPWHACSPATGAALLLQRNLATATFPDFSGHLSDPRQQSPLGARARPCARARGCESCTGGTGCARKHRIADRSLKDELREGSVRSPACGCRPGRESRPSRPSEPRWSTPAPRAQARCPAAAGRQGAVLQKLCKVAKPQEMLLVTSCPPNRRISKACKWDC